MPNDPSIVWFWGIVVLVACVLAAWRVRRPALDRLVARVLAITALVVVTIAGLGPAAPRAARRSRSFQFVELAAILAFVGWGLSRGVVPPARILHVLLDRGRGAVGGRGDDHDAPVRVRADPTAGVPRARWRRCSASAPARGCCCSCSACPISATPAPKPAEQRCAAMRARPDRSAQRRRRSCSRSRLDADRATARRPTSERPTGIGRGGASGGAPGGGSPDRQGRELSAAGARSGRRAVRAPARSARRRARRGVRRQPRGDRPAGIGTRPPRTMSAGRISSAGCYGELVTLDPTGLVLVRAGIAIAGRWLRICSAPGVSRCRRGGSPRSRRPAGARVSVFVDGRRWRGSPGGVPLTRHSEIVLEVGPHVPPHHAYTFPPGT